jgi:hypothetical protein
MKRHTIRG